mgnify:CR=1 FL=1|tara:strand:- start:191 stop:397 length:207 start_codon:yes stop_codon:yes gene_type:complete
MEKWLSPRDNKETRACFSCGDYKMKAQFYDWYSHPALKTITNSKYYGAICSKCAKREAGSNYFDNIKK